MLLIHHHFKSLASCNSCYCSVHLPLFLSEVLYENDSFPERELAALVASKVYYHLGSFQVY